MTDYRSLDRLHVFRQDEYVGDLYRLPKGCAFHYTKEFLSSNEPPIALNLPRNEDGVRVEGVFNLPTFFAGLLPEGVMFNAVRSMIGAASDDLFGILAASGFDAIGDVDVRVPGADKSYSPVTLEVAAKLIEFVQERRRGLSPNSISAIPGVQPKLSIGQVVRSGRNSSFIAKFNSPEFPRLIENEFACMRLAKKCRLNVATVQLDPRALIVQRFDRVSLANSATIKKIHVEDMLQAMDLFPNQKYSLEYFEVMKAMESLGVSKATLLDAIRLFAFSYMIGNGDLHAKNVSVIRSHLTGEWTLSPAYDLLSTLPYTHQLDGADRMAIALFDESFGRYTLDEFIEFGQQFGIPGKAVNRAINRLARLVLKFLPDLPQDLFPPEVITMISLRAQSLVI